jgi:hypothetical protein
VFVQVDEDARRWMVVIGLIGDATVMYDLPQRIRIAIADQEFRNNAKPNDGQDDNGHTNLF